MDMLRVTTRWTGFHGAPGYSNFFFAGDGGVFDGGLFGDVAQSVSDRTAEALESLQPVLPTGVLVQVEPEVARIDSDTGEVQEYAPVDPPQFQYAGQGDGGYSGASGAVVNWRTNDVRFGRRIRGRTFIVPLAGDVYDDEGSLSPSALADIREFAGAMLAPGLGVEMGVWSRPRNGEGGVFATATSYNVPDLAAVLRSRRD